MTADREVPTPEPASLASTRIKDAQRIAELEGALRRLEWSAWFIGRDSKTFKCCPECSFTEVDGQHASFCELAKLLSQPEAKGAKVDG